MRKRKFSKWPTSPPRQVARCTHWRGRALAPRPCRGVTPRGFCACFRLTSHCTQLCLEHRWQTLDATRLRFDRLCRPFLSQVLSPDLVGLVYGFYCTGSLRKIKQLHRAYIDRLLSPPRPRPREAVRAFGRSVLLHSSFRMDHGMLCKLLEWGGLCRHGWTWAETQHHVLRLWPRIVLLDDAEAMDSEWAAGQLSGKYNFLSN